MSVSIVVHQEASTLSNKKSQFTTWVTNNLYNPILPGLPEDVAKYCLALVTRSNFPAMGRVSNKWQSFIRNKEFMTLRKNMGMLEEWLYMLTTNVKGHGSYWKAFDCFGNMQCILPPMPGPVKAKSGVVTINGKLLVIAGYSLIGGYASASADVYQYDSYINSWCKLANMNVARYDFACAEVKGILYAVGGYTSNRESLSCAEAYNPDTDKWTLIENMRRPRRGCFAFGFEGKLYVMGGGSSFTIGSSKFLDIYNPETHTWSEVKNGRVMVTAQAVLGNKLFCMEWKNPREIFVFNMENNSCNTIQIPLKWRSSVGFRFGRLDGKLLLISLNSQPGYSSLVYDPSASPGMEWRISKVKPSGMCLSCVTVKA